MEKYSEKSASVSEKRKLTEVQQYEEDVKNVIVIYLVFGI